MTENLPRCGETPCCGLRPEPITYSGPKTEMAVSMNPEADSPSNPRLAGWRCPECGGRVLIVRDVGKGHRLRVTENGNVQPGSVVKEFDGGFRWTPYCENACDEGLEFEDFGFVPASGFIMDEEGDGS